MNIWLEDRSSKKQWKTGFVSQENYVTPANAFFDAGPKDYALCFKQSLDCALDESEDVQRKLIPLKDDKLRLEMSVNIRMLQSVRRATYTFELQPMVLERIDVLEAKFRDLQMALEASQESIWLHHESEDDHSESPGKLLWKPLDSKAFKVVENQTAVQWLLSGAYSIGVVVNHVPDADTGALELQKNGVVIQRVCIAEMQDYDEGISSSLLCVAKVAKGDNVAVTCTGTSFVEVSYLTVVRIGN